MLDEATIYVTARIGREKLAWRRLSSSRDTVDVYWNGSRKISARVLGNNLDEIEKFVDNLRKRPYIKNVRIVYSEKK